MELVISTYSNVNNDKIKIYLNNDKIIRANYIGENKLYNLNKTDLINLEKLFKLAYLSSNDFDINFNQITLNNDNYTVCLNFQNKFKLYNIKTKELDNCITNFIINQNLPKFLMTSDIENYLKFTIFENNDDKAFKLNLYKNPNIYKTELTLDDLEFFIDNLKSLVTSKISVIHYDELTITNIKHKHPYFPDKEKGERILFETDSLSLVLYANELKIILNGMEKWIS